MKAYKHCIYTNYIPYSFTIMDASIQGHGEKYKQRLNRMKTYLNMDKQQYQLNTGRKWNVQDVY